MSLSLRPPSLRTGKRNPWPLVWSLTLHAWFAGLAIMMVWRIWPGHAEVAVPSLFEPSDGGERSTIRAAMPMEKSRQRTAANLKNKLHSSRTSEVAVTERIQLVAAFDPVSRPYQPGGGWNGGVGKSFIHGGGGDGFGPGSGRGFAAGWAGFAGKPMKAATPDAFPRDTVIVLDVSGSVRAQHSGADSPALREFIHRAESLNAAVRFNVVCFAGAAVKFSEDSVPASARNVAAAVAWARTQFSTPHSGSSAAAPEEGSSGTSRLDLGIKAAMDDQPQEVILISDGQPIVREGNRSLPHNAILARINAVVPESATPPVIHTVATRESGSGFLRELAAEFHGQYRMAVD